MTSKRDRYLQLKHELLDSCGQCMGFRAKGIDLKNKDANTACTPGKECHKTCPALGMGRTLAAVVSLQEQTDANIKPLAKINSGKVEELVIQREQPLHIVRDDQKLVEQNKYLAQNCHRCGSGEDKAVLIPCRHDGKSLWGCTRCLPALIHG